MLLAWEGLAIASMKDDIRLYTDFLGVGYRYWDVHTHVLIIFNKRKELLKLWNRVVKWWPDDEIKMRFIEDGDGYEFVLYGQSRILEDKWVLMKDLQMSGYYKKFKDEFDGSAYLGLALYKPEEDNTYELEVFNYRKKVTDIQFLKETEVDQDNIISRSREALRNSRSR
jgi:hypothetical protein